LAALSFGSKHSTTNNANNMSTQSLQHQLAATQQMLNFLEQYANSLNQISSQYNDKILTMRQTGVPVEACDTYEQRFLIPEIQAMKKIEGQIRQQDIPYVKDVLNKLNEALIMAKK